MFSSLDTAAARSAALEPPRFTQCFGSQPIGWLVVDKLVLREVVFNLASQGDARYFAAWQAIWALQAASAFPFGWAVRI